MTIDWYHFTPLAALIGGSLLGLATALLILFCGRILGISGIIGGLLQQETLLRQDASWRIRFLTGLVLAPLLYYSVVPALPPIIDGSIIQLVSAGLLVGIGTSLGSGCTSGHGICGLSRFSARSLTATIVFMFFGMLTVWIMRHVL